MKKRIVCFIGAVVLMLSVLLVLPTSAAYEPDVLVAELYQSSGTTFGMVDSISAGGLYFLGETLFVAVGDPLRISGDGFVPNGLEFTYDGSSYVVVGVDTINRTYSITDLNGGNPSEGTFYIYSAYESGGGSDDAYDEGYSAGLSAGYNNGYAAGLTAGREQGRQEGFDEGFDEGFEEGAATTNGYDRGYAAGVAAGRELGYQDGYQAGLQEASKVYEQLGQNVFSFATVTAHGFTEAGDEEFTITVTPQLISNGVSFASVYTQILAEIDRLMPGTSTVSSLDITFTWPEAQSFDYGLLYFSATDDNFDFIISDGSSSSTLAAAKDPGADVYYYRRYASGAPGYADSIVKNYMVRSVQLKYASLEDQSLSFLQSLQLYSGGPFFTNGYAAGYTSGLNTSNGAAFEQGKAEGFKNGLIRGKEEGIQITENGDWLHLMTAVIDTPINAFNSLFSFEILGLDMRVAFGSLLALCMFLFVVKKVIL